MRLRALALAGFAFAAIGAGAASAPLSQWAGRYSKSFMNGTVDGDRYRSTDILEVRPVDATHADIALSLEFYNGHSCWIDGRATLEGSRLVLLDPDLDRSDGAKCRFELWRDRTAIRWSDGEGSCTNACGARGTLSVGSMPLRSKRRLPAKPLELEG